MTVRIWLWVVSHRGRNWPWLHNVLLLSPLQKGGITDGRGAWRDNVFVERLWRSVKYERVYLRAYDSVSAARKDIAEYIAWYNDERPHSSLDGQTPTRVWLDSLIPLKVAA